MGCFQILKCRLPECDSTTPDVRGVVSGPALGDAGGADRDEVRRNRINPRVIKRKMSKWKKKRPEHRQPSALEENLCRDSGYDSLNGIAINPKTMYVRGLSRLVNLIRKVEGRVRIQIKE